MARFVLSPPPEWLVVEPGRYRVGQVLLSVGALGPLPEDPLAFAVHELGEEARSRTRPVRPPAGWPAVCADVPGRALLLIRVLERGVIARLEGEPAALEALAPAILGVLTSGTVDWGEPAFYTIPELLAGVAR